MSVHVIVHTYHKSITFVCPFHRSAFFPWNPNCFHSIPWNHMESMSRYSTENCLPWNVKYFSTECCGFPWNAMDFHDKVSHWIPWKAMENMLQVSTTFNEKPLKLCPDTPRQDVCHGIFKIYFPVMPWKSVSDSLHGNIFHGYPWISTVWVGTGS